MLRLVLGCLLLVEAIPFTAQAQAEATSKAYPTDSESGPATIRTSQLDQQWLDTVVSIERQLPAKQKVPTDPAVQEVPIGTGFLVASNRNHIVLVTAKHVIHDSQGKLLTDLVYRINRTTGSSQPLKDADVIASGGGSWFISQNDDVAVRFLPFVRGASVKTIPLARFVDEKQVEAGTPMVVLGFPIGLRSTNHANPIARGGMVARAESKTLIADLFVFPGNSGGPVLYVPAFKTGGVSFGGAEIVPHEMLIGLVSSYIPYTEVAVSMQTNRARIIFEENSGLANLVPAWVVKGLITSEAVVVFEDHLGSQK